MKKITKVTALALAITSVSATTLLASTSYSRDFNPISSIESIVTDELSISKFDLLPTEVIEVDQVSFDENKYTGILPTTGIVPANVIFGVTRNLTVQGVTIQGRSDLIVEPGGLVSSGTSLWTVNIPQAEPGWLGVEAILVAPNGALLRSGSQFNTVRTAGIATTAPMVRNAQAGSIWQGTGFIGLFNATNGSYEWQQTARTPAANARNVDTSITQAAIDNLLLAIETNDLVPVIGINGIEGYAYARHLRVIPEHPSLAPEGRNIRLVNVYSSLGEILDSFEVFYGSGWLIQE